MLDGNFAENVMTFPTIRAYPPHPQETSGVGQGSQAIYRYSLKDSDYPILSIVDKITDPDGNTISPGHYELALSDEWDFLILMQTKNPVAIIPVFKVEEDKEAFNREFDKDYQKIKKKREKERAKTNKQRAEVGMPPDEEKIHMRATIEYIKNGNYYLIKYERGTIRAWGAIKSL